MLVKRIDYNVFITSPASRLDHNHSNSCAMLRRRNKLPTELFQMK